MCGCSGWFSDRAATFLAAGRPVITQETGFSNVLPTGAGLFGFSTMEDILAAIETMNRDYAGQCAAARDIARECFGHDVVLGRMLGELGVAFAAPVRSGRVRFVPRDLALTPVSRRPIRMPEATVQAVLALPLPAAHAASERPSASVVIVMFNNLFFNRLCLLNLIEQGDADEFEIIVADNGSTDGTAEFLRDIAARDARVRVIFNTENRGFAAATNQGLAAARGAMLVLLNNDTLVLSGWLARLRKHLADASTGLLGAVTNRIGNEAEIPTDYATPGGFLRFARERAASHARRAFEIPMAAMFCVAMRRDAFEKIGPLDEQFGVGMFEDDDYAMRCRAAGLRVVCAEDVFVHHFGEASFGDLCPTGEYGAVFVTNRERFERKWNTQWKSHDGRAKPAYDGLVARLHDAVIAHTPEGASVLVVSKGDDALIEITGRHAAHFPQGADGGYAGHHPADDAEAIAGLEKLRAAGALSLVIPEPSTWWLEHYAGLRAHLASHADSVEIPGTCRIFNFGKRPA